MRCLAPEIAADVCSAIFPRPRWRGCSLPLAGRGGANGRSRERPILLRIETKAGHGAGKPITKQIEEGTDIYWFLFWQLGIKP